MIATPCMEGYMTTLSTETTDNTNGGESGPENGGDGTNEDLAKKHNFNAWTTWDD